MIELLERLFKTHNLLKEEIIYILENIDLEQKAVLIEYAHKTRLASYGPKVFMRGLIEFSNYCRQDCLYCEIALPWLY